MAAKKAKKAAKKPAARKHAARKPVKKAAAKKPGKMGKRARLAETLEKLHK